MKNIAAAFFALCAFAALPVSAHPVHQKPAHHQGAARSAWVRDFAELASFPQVDDASLATMRGRYIPPISTRVALPIFSRPATDTQPLVTQPNANGPDPLAGVQGAGQVTYFGVQMISSWSVQGNSGTQGVEVGSTIGINAVTHTITISKWSSSENGGLPALSTDGNSFSGSPPANNIVNGVGQSIQVAGNNNDVSNAATLTISTNTPTFVIVPTLTTCGSICTTTIGANAVGISITTAAGVVSQQVGVGGVTQSVQLAGNGNSIWSTMQMDAQVKTISGFNAGGLLPVLQTLNWTH